MVFLDLKCEGQASLVEAKVDFNDESSTGTNNKWKYLTGFRVMSIKICNLVAGEREEIIVYICNLKMK